MNKPPLKLALWEFPDGPAQGMDQQIIVLKQTRAGDYKDCYVANLLDGDRYMVKEPHKLPPRSDTTILDFIIDNKISFKYGEEDVYVYRGENESYLCDHPYSHDTRKDDIRDVVQYIMDMEEL